MTQKLAYDSHIAAVVQHREQRARHPGLQQHGAQLATSIKAREGG